MKRDPIEIMTHQAQTLSDGVAFVFHDEVWTYKRVAIEADRIARGMAAHGVRPGDRVALHMMNRPEFIVAYFACFRLGAIAAPLRTAFKSAELGPLLQRLKPALYIGESALYESIAGFDNVVLPDERRFIVDAAVYGHGQSWRELREAGHGADLPAVGGGERPAVLITTSGTSGQPKFVVHTPASLSWSASMLSDNWKWSERDVAAMPLPLAHMSGLCLYLALYQIGATFVLLEKFEAAVVLDAIETHRCTLHVGFPAHYAAMLGGLHLRQRNLRSLRYCFTSGDACPIDLQVQVSASFGAPLQNIWATTEAAGTLAAGRRPGPFVRIVDDTQIRLIGDDGKDVAEGMTGELLVRGPNLFSGYWNDDGATSQSLQGGWYHTGDFMRRTGDELEFMGRKKDIIIRGATNISPVEVEQAIVASHPMVEEAAVVGIPDPVLGQRVIGFVRLAGGDSNSITAEILQYLEPRLAAYKIPERVTILDALPRTALGKIDRAALQILAMGQYRRPTEADERSRKRPAERRRRAPAK